MREPLGAQEEHLTSKQENLLGRQPEPCTSKNLWQLNQIPAEAHERTFGGAGRALHKQTREPLGRQPEPRTSKNLWERSQSLTEGNERTFWVRRRSSAQANKKTFGKAARALH
eukprot:10641873-Karenia_brevis.AAC.1